MKKRIAFDLLIIFLLGLLPLLWFPGQTMLFGHDAGIPFDPVTHFLDRFHVWSQRLGIGTDQSFGLLGAILIHGIEAVLIWLGFTLKQQQLIQFIFWFVLPGFAMYFFAYKTWPNKRYLPLIASVIYMVNFYLIQAWFVAERTKFTIYAALPFILYFSYAYILQKMSWKKSVIATGLILGLLNGGGSFPLYGGLVIFMAIAYIYINLLYFNKEVLKRTILYSIGVLIIYVLLNAYWIFSYTFYILGFYTRDLALAGGSEGVLSWSTYLSTGSSFLNIFRGQGIPEWYLNPYHAYASTFLTNPILIVLSFAFPLLAYAALFLVKEKRDKFYIYLFVLISLVTMIFMSGPKSQLGFIYEFMVQYVPGFAIFRSNFYKFGYAFWFCYAILIAFTLDIIFARVSDFLKKRKLSFKPAAYILPILFIAGYLLYHYPVLNGKFLDYTSEPGRELSTRITVPQYVFDFGNWSNQQDESKRYMIVPELSETGYIAYDWGYWSLAPINSLQTKNSFVHNTFLVLQGERLLMKQMYNALLSGDIESFSDFAEVFAIDGIVVHEDFDWQNKFWGTKSPYDYEKVLNNNPNFKLVKTFGKWKVYDITGRDKSLRMTATPKLGYLDGDLNNLVSFPYYDPREPLFMANNDRTNSGYFMNEATSIYLSPECIDCTLRGIDVGFKYYNPKLLPGSSLYPIVTYQENQVKKKANDFNSYLNYLLTISDRRIIEAKWMVDSGTKTENLENAYNNYIGTLNELHTFINKNDWGLSGKDESKAAQTIVGHLREQARMIESIYDNNVNNINKKIVLGQAYDLVLKIDTLARDRMWMTTDTREKKYLFDSPKPGNYEVFVKRSSLANPDGPTQDLSMTFSGDTPQVLRPTGVSSEWINFGTVDVKEKDLKITFEDTSANNLVENVEPVLPDDASGIEVNNNAYNFTTDSQNKCITFEVKDLNIVDSAYLISYEYRNLTENEDLSFYFAKPTDAISKISVKDNFLPNSRKWVKNTDVEPGEKYIFTPTESSMNLYFCNGFLAREETLYKKTALDNSTPQIVSQVKNISVTKISIPSIVLYQGRKDVGDEEFVLGFKKPSPVAYAVDVKKTDKPVTLIMRENYGKYWQLCDKQKQCLSFDDKSHFASAGFTNAWYLKNGMDDKIYLYYYPQQTYTWGAYLSIATLVLILGGIIWSVFRKR